MVTIKLKAVNKVQSFYDVNLVHLVHISTAKLFDIVINWHLLPFYDKMINQLQESYWQCMMTFEKKWEKVVVTKQTLYPSKLWWFQQKNYVNWITLNFTPSAILSWYEPV